MPAPHYGLTCPQPHYGLTCPHHILVGCACTPGGYAHTPFRVDVPAPHSRWPCPHPVPGGCARTLFRFPDAVVTNVQSSISSGNFVALPQFNVCLFWSQIFHVAVFPAPK